MAATTLRPCKPCRYGNGATSPLHRRLPRPGRGVGVERRTLGGMAADFGVTSMTAPLRRVLVRRPATAATGTAAGWRVPDPVALERQHEAFCELLAGLGRGGRGRRRARRPGRRGVHARPAGPHAARRHPAAHGASRCAQRSRGTPRRSSSGSASRCSGRCPRARTPTAATASGSTTRHDGDRPRLPDEPRGGGGARGAAPPRGSHVETYDMPHDQGPAHVLHLQSFLFGGHR